MNIELKNGEVIEIYNNFGDVCNEINLHSFLTNTFGKDREKLVSTLTAVLKELTDD
jgi:hypothetical protein